MSDLEKLRGDHAELVKLVRRLADYVAEPAPPPQVELFALRRSLTTTLIGHLKAEDWVLYPRLMDSGDPEVTRTARAFNEEMGGLAASFSAHIEKWTAIAISADWPGYCADTRTIIDTLIDRITRENRELYPLLEKLEQPA